MKSLFNPSHVEEIKERIAKVNADSKPEWGVMTASQMMKHCQLPIKFALYPSSNSNLPKYNFFQKLLFRSFKKSMYDDSTWRKGIPTPKAFQVRDSPDFAEERTELIRLIDAIHMEKARSDWPPHPAFGDFTPEQIGKLQYKHLDHHLRQFGV